MSRVGQHLELGIRDLRDDRPPDLRATERVVATADEPRRRPDQARVARGARTHTSCAVIVAPTFDRALARWCYTVECDRPRR